MKRTTNKTQFQLDAYEKTIEEAILSGKYIPSTTFVRDKEKIVESAKEHVAKRKQKSVTLRMHEDVLAEIKVKADSEGLPYQTLIGLLIKQYVDGRFQIQL